MNVPRFAFAQIQSLILKDRTVLERIHLTYRIMRHAVLTAFGIPTIENLFLCPSHECNADCIHCYEKFMHKRFSHSLSTDEIKTTIDQFHELGGFHIHFCSGELLLRKDAYALIAHARNKNIIVSIVSNGIAIDAKTVERLKEVGVSCLFISIDSADKDRHDRHRNKPGCFEKACAAIQLAREKDIVPIIWTYVSRSHMHELEGIKALAQEIGAAYVFVFFTLLSGHFFNAHEENLTFEEREELRKKYCNDPVIELEFPSEKSRCRGGGQEHICVMPSGDITFCPPVPYSYGNIRQDKLKHILPHIQKEHKRFCHAKCTGQCIVNFAEYRKKTNARFIYERDEQ